MNIRGMGMGLALLVGVAQADSVTFAMGNVFSGSGSPSGAPTLTIDDEGTPGDVKFVFDATPLSSGTEKIAAWYLNTAFDLSSGGTFSGFTNILGYVTGVSLSRTFNSTAGAFKADGDGYYDWVFGFPTSGSGAFADGDKFSFVFSYPGITASAFDAWSLSGPNSNAGPFQSAIHLLGTGAGGQESLWISEGGGYTIPEPAFALLALLGLMGGLLARRRS